MFGWQDCAVVDATAIQRKVEETHQMEGVGRFGHVTDPEGNRAELWQPST